MSQTAVPTDMAEIIGRMSKGLDAAAQSIKSAAARGFARAARTGSQPAVFIPILEGATVRLHADASQEFITIEVNYRLADWNALVKPEIVKGTPEHEHFQAQMKGQDVVGYDNTVMFGDAARVVNLPQDTSRLDW